MQLPREKKKRRGSESGVRIPFCDPSFLCDGLCGRCSEDAAILHFFMDCDLFLRLSGYKQSLYDCRRFQMKTGMSRKTVDNGNPLRYNIGTENPVV